MRSEIAFSSFQMIINSSVSNFKMMKLIYDKIDADYDVEGTHYQVVKDINEAQKYIWIEFSFGKALPYGDVYDKEKGENVSNPRNKSQLELSHQFFVFYNDETKLIYISNSNKKTLIEKILCKANGDIVIIKNIYKSLSEFVEMIKEVEKIRLVAVENLFTQGSGLFDEAGNAFGLGDPEKIDVSMYFNKRKINKDFKEFAKEFQSKKEFMKLEKLVCVGYDDNKIPHIFNTEHLIDKIPLKIERNSNGLFNPHKVKIELLDQMGLLNV